MVSIELKNLKPKQVQDYLQSAIAPRPIGLVSTISAIGEVNLSPFSFFNMFSSYPPVVIFSPSRRIRDNTIKHTLENLLQVPEAVVHIVDYAMVKQVNLASSEYDRGVNEFEKAGFAMEAALKVQPPMVRESKIKMECRVMEIKSLGKEGGAGNLVICEVLYLHIDESILDEDQRISPGRLNLVARMGGDMYALINRENIFHLEKPRPIPGMGIDALPPIIRESNLFTGNHLAQLAGVKEIPRALGCFGVVGDQDTTACKKRVMAIQLQAMQLLDTGNVDMAWQVLLQITGIPVNRHHEPTVNI